MSFIVLKNNFKYFIFNKPFYVLSQFSKEGEKETLADYLKLPSDIYPVGRLDYDSEGILILTNDNFLKNHLLNPENNHTKKYFVQVEGIPKDNQIYTLENGVEINLKSGNYITKKARCNILKDFKIEERIIPIRKRKNIPTSWIEIQIIEGKNRQIRKMTAKVGLPTLRLIRNSIENLELNDLKPGKVIEISKNSIYKKLNI